MKKILFLLLLFFSVNACVPVTQVVPAQTPTPTLLPTVAPTNTKEPEKLCPSGNFDVNVENLRTMIEQDDGSVIFRDQEEVSQDIVDVMNNGGVEKVISYYSLEYSDEFFRAADITGDGVPEVFMRVGGSIKGFVCINGVYQSFHIDGDVFDFRPLILFLGDMNDNGKTDIAIAKTTCHYCLGVALYEWDGNNFQDLINVRRELGEDVYYFNFAELLGYGYGEVEDIDGDGIFELILQGGIPSYLGGLGGGDGHWREETVVYVWDGAYYVFQSRQYAAPEFRYEAVQDGDDKLINYQDYDAALYFYEQAINDKTLASWDAEEWWRLVFLPDGDLGQPDPHLIPYNEKEYQQLSSYARYRLMLVYILQGKFEEAKGIYAELLDYVKSAPDGQPYAELATIFLNEYSTSSNIEKACSLTVDYTEEHPEILYPLGNTDETWYGVLVRGYSPEDICLQTEELEIKE